MIEPLHEENIKDLKIKIFKDTDRKIKWEKIGCCWIYPIQIIFNEQEFKKTFYAPITTSSKKIIVKNIIETLKKNYSKNLLADPDQQQFIWNENKFNNVYSN